MKALCLVALGFMSAMNLNLLPDPSFEEGKWELATWDNGKSSHDFASPGRTGEKCAHLVGISAETGPINELAVSPVLDVKAGEEYLFAIWYKSGGEVRPYLSFITYRESFATQGWKTPQVQYESHSLEPSEEWQLALWRFRTDAGSVQMRVMARLNGRGEVWYDDASLVAMGAWRMRPLVRGDVSKLPRKRLYEAEVMVPAGQAWTLTIKKPTGRELSRVQGEGSQALARVRFSADEGDKLLALLSSDGAVLDYQEFLAPPLLELKLDSCRYRNSIYASAAPRELTGELVAHATAEVYGGFKYSVALVPSEGSPDAAKEQSMTRPSQRFSLSLQGLKPGEWRVLVRLKGVPGVEKLETPLRVLPPGKPHEVILDDFNRLLVDGKPLFPAGFYGAPDKEELTRPIAEAGYNTVLTYNTNPQWCRNWLDMCERLGLWGILHLPRPFVADFDEAKLREALRVVKDHPALLAYYIFDEPSPGVEHQRPEDLKRVYDVLKDEDPYHPVTICINVPTNEALYLDCYDVVMIDVYPVRLRPDPLTTIAHRMDHAWAATGGRKPVWFIPQTFGYDIVQGLEGDPRWVTPTPAQERVMQYLSLAHGARGSIAYCYHVYTAYDAEAKKAGKWPWKLGGYLPDQQKTLWSALVDLGREYKALQEALTQPRRATAAFEEDRVHVGWYYGASGKAWLLAVNADEEESVRAMIPALPEGVTGNIRGARDITSDKDIVVRGGQLTLDLPPLSTAAIEVAVSGL